MARVLLELDYYEDAEEIKMHLNARRMSCALDEIYNMCRSELKHGQEELSTNIDQLLERIKDEASIVHTFD